MIQIHLKKTLLVSGLLVGAALGVGAQPEADEYRVYKALLADSRGSVISNVTSHSRITKEHRKMLGGGEKDIFASYKRKNSTGFPLQSDKFGYPNITLVSNAEVKPFFEIADRNELRAEEEFNKSLDRVRLFTFQRVGFNKTSTRALLNVTYAGICGTCSESYFLLLEKSADKWLVLRKTVAWMS